MKTIWNNITWFFRRLKRVWDFLPHIWRGYDFDYRYAIDIFKYQLERTADFMASDKAMTVDADVRAKRIRTAIELLDKVYDEEYGMEYMDQLESKYGKSNFEFVEIDELDKKGNPYYKMLERYEKDYTVPELLEIEKEKKYLMNLSSKKQEKAEKLVWMFISHNIRGWWD